MKLPTETIHLLATTDGKEMKFIICKGISKHNEKTKSGISNITKLIIEEFVSLLLIPLAENNIFAAAKK